MCSDLLEDSGGQLAGTALLAEQILCQFVNHKFKQLCTIFTTNLKVLILSEGLFFATQLSTSTHREDVNADEYGNQGWVNLILDLFDNAI